MSILEWALVGAAGFVVGIALALVGLLLLPENYFVDGHKKPWAKRTAAEKARAIVKNLSGVVLVVVGVALLFLPGQGLLTVVVGLMLVDFPGKRRVVAKLLARPKMLDSANRWRARFGRPPLEAPPHDEK